MSDIKLKAPSITNLIVYKLSANFIHLKWDNAGDNFYYFVEFSVDGGSWQNIGRTKDQFIFFDKLTKETEYKFRISVNGEGFIASEWTETELLKTFKTNLYNISKMQKFTLSSDYISKRLLNNDMYIDFSSDDMYATLMSSDFTYLDRYNNISQVDNFILKDKSTHQIQEKLTQVCTDVDRVMIAQFDNVLYSFERFQTAIKVSNDRGQSWYYYKAFSDRVGNPVSKTVAVQNSTTSFVLGYQKLFYGRPPPADIRFSSDAYKFSDNEISFSKVGLDEKIPFETEIFSTFATLPADVTKYAEAIAANDDSCYIAARDVIRYINVRNTPIIEDIDSPFYGERKFDDEVLRVTGIETAVIKKMEVVNEQLFVLVTGEVAIAGQSPIKYPVQDSIIKGVYKLVGSNFERVYGNTANERELITHEYSNISTNGIDIFLGTSDYNYKHNTPGMTTNKHIHFAMLSSDESSNFETWKFKSQEYYNEFNFSYFHRDRTRTWINNTYNAVVIYPDTIFTKKIDINGKTSPGRIQKEVWKNGFGTVFIPDIEFDGFGKYAGGVLIHKISGEVFGYYEFDYRVRNYVKHQWKPNLVALQLELTNQVNEKPFSIIKQTGLKDPNLVPLIHKMNPSSYIKEDDEFMMFVTRYLEFISEGTNSAYIKLLNLIKNKNAREPDSFEYLFSEMYKRNIYLNKEKRDSVVRFFESRKGDFYSSKGTEASYKFLFKLLYNEEVDVDIESKNTIEYDIVVYSDNITEDIVGTSLYTTTGRSNVTYIDRDYVNGSLVWRITIHNLLGRFVEGQEIKGESTSFSGIIKQGIRGKDMLSNSIDYIDRGRSSYVMRIRSQMPTSRYRDDMLRFVHPVGFGFIGVTLLSVLINSGLNMRHIETIIRKLATYKFDSGYPTKWPERVLVLNPDGSVTRDPITGEVVYAAHPRAGDDFEIPAPDPLISPIDNISDFPFTVVDNVNENFVIASVDIDPPVYIINPISDYDLSEFGDDLTKLMPSNINRRSPHSPLFDASGTSWSMFKNLQDKYLKDNIGNHRDPIATQEKIQENL